MSTKSRPSKAVWIGLALAALALACAFVIWGHRNKAPDRPSVSVPSAAAAPEQAPWSQNCGPGPCELVDAESHEDGKSPAHPVVSSRGAPEATARASGSLLAHRATSLRQLMDQLERLPASSVDRQVLLASAHHHCNGARRDRAQIASGMVQSGLVGAGPEADDLAASWQQMTLRFCDSQSLVRLEALWHEGAPEAGALDATFDETTGSFDDRLRAEDLAAATLETIRTTDSRVQFSNALIGLAELEYGPFAPGLHPGPVDPHRRVHISIAAAEYATCEWSGACGPGTIWVLSSCRDALFCQPNADFRAIFRHQYGPADLRRIETLSQALLALRERGAGG